MTGHTSFSGQEDAHVPRIVAERVIAADPASMALLLAAPAAVELWPGAELSASELDDRLHVGVTRPGAPVATEAVVRTQPPVRTPTAFLIRFAVTGPRPPTVEGRLVLSYAADSDSAVSATRVRLELDIPRGSPDGCLSDTLDRWAPHFLEALAAAAEGRSRAA
jgi:hypothetical protein